MLNRIALPSGRRGHAALTRVTGITTNVVYKMILQGDCQVGLQGRYFKHLCPGQKSEFSVAGFFSKSIGRGGNLPSLFKFHNSSHKPRFTVGSPVLTRQLRLTVAGMTAPVDQGATLTVGVYPFALSICPVVRSDLRRHLFCHKGRDPCYLSFSVSCFRLLCWPYYSS
jgi:hypothetical protein